MSALATHESCATRAPQQLDFFSEHLTHEAALYHYPAGGGFFTINQRAPGKVKLRQACYPNSKLLSVIDMVLQGYDGGDCYISQQSFTNRTRLTAHVMSLSGCYVDLDPYKVFKKGPPPPLALQLLAIARPEDRVDFVLNYCVDRGIELPSLIMHSGRGLYLKWLLTTTLPRAALPRWNAVQKELTDLFTPLAADPTAKDASRILRLCGTQNAKAAGENTSVRVLWTRPGVGAAPLTFDFETLCSAVLTWSQEEVHVFRAKQAIWDANKAAAAKTLNKLISRASSPGELSAATLWWDRLSDIRRLVELRYGASGVPEDSGERNNYCWVVANALSYNVDSARLYPEMCSVFREICPSYTPAEVRTSASSILTRVRTGVERYKMTTAKFRSHFGIDDSEARQLLTLGAGRGRKKPVNEGVMGFERMEHLPHAEYLAETTRRRQEAAKYMHNIRALASEDQRAMALRLSGEGMSIRAIADEMRASKSTIARWIKVA